MAIEELKDKRLLVVSDVHANIVAFDAVLDQEARQFEGIINLGDIVGYGPHPNSTVQRLNKHPNISVFGNHDIVACGIESAVNFNLYAYKIITWTEKILNRENKTWLSSLSHFHIQDRFCFAHGNHKNCEVYIMSKEDALPVIQFMVDENKGGSRSPQFCFLGHTHLPMICQIKRAAADAGDFSTLTHVNPDEFPFNVTLDSDSYYVINVGSVGQPRDHNNCSSYGLLDTREEHPVLSIRRITYNIPKTQESMTGFGLPKPMIERLSKGI